MATDNGGDTTKTIEELQAELENLRKSLKEANAESAQRRLKIKELEDAKTAGLSESEQLKKDLAELKTLRAKDDAEKKQRKIMDAVVAKAEELGFEHPKDAALFVDTSKVEITEGDVVKGFEKELEALASSNRLPMKGVVTRKGTLTLPKTNQTDKDNQIKVNPRLTSL